MHRFRAFETVLVALAVGVAARAEEPAAGNRVATALQFAHHYARPAALSPGRDRALKIQLIAALNKSADLPAEAVAEYFDAAVFRKLSGGAAAIPLGTMERLVRDKLPPARQDIHANTRRHADLLTTQFDLIEESHRKSAEALVAWIVENYRPGTPLAVVAVCTGNTRRSMLAATMGNLAASYYGLPELRFASGGTDPDAFNPRTIATLQEIGIDIAPTGEEAPRGRTGTANPIYRVRWGKGQETREFSKKYTDAANPRGGFAAIVVCSEADEACPKVAGAAVRIPVPYLDPKAFDGAPFEAGKYAERRDDIGRFMLSVALQARRRLEADGMLK